MPPPPPRRPHGVGGANRFVCNSRSWVPSPTAHPCRTLRAVGAEGWEEPGVVEKASEGVGCQPGPRPPAKQRPTWEPNPGVVAPAAVWHATQDHPLKAAGALHPAQKLPPSLPQFLATLSFFRALSRPSPTATLSLFSPPGPPPHPTLRSPRDAPFPRLGPFKVCLSARRPWGGPALNSRRTGGSQRQRRAPSCLCVPAILTPTLHVRKPRLAGHRACPVTQAVSAQAGLDSRPVS